MKIQLADVSLQYDGKPPVFQGVNLTMDGGDFLVIQGASGVGKSSLLRLLNRLQEPTTGQILVDGKPISTYEITSLRRKIGYVQQTPIMVPGSVKDNLSFPAQFRAARGRKPPDRSEIQRWLDLFLLKHLQLSDDALKLSVGQKQRIALIRTLLTQPEMLLCDEPTSALDQQSKEIVEDSLEHLNVERGIGIVLVTHVDFTPKQVQARKFLLRPDGLEVAGET